MKYNVVSILLLILILVSCSDKRDLVQPADNREEFSFHPVDYSENHFFVDTVYSSRKYNLWYKYYRGSPDDYSDYYRIKKIEVWGLTTLPVSDYEIYANSFIDLPSRNSFELSDQQYRSLDIEDVAGKIYRGNRFVPLEDKIDYIVNKDLGLISLKTELPVNRLISVAYSIEGETPDSLDDICYGDFKSQFNEIDSLSVSVNMKVLKLIRPPHLISPFRNAWRMQLRNIYKIGDANFAREGFELQVRYLSDGLEPESEYDGMFINGESITEAYGLIDAYGHFKFEPGKTVLPETGEIVFPVLQPFGVDMPELMKDKGLAFHYMYDTLKSVASRQELNSKFVITGKYYPD